MPSAFMNVFNKRPKLSADEPDKPYFRGRLHRYGFYFALILGAVILCLAKDFKSRCSFFVYLLSSLLVYGISSTFHLTVWKTARSEALMQKLDHACIFLLIAGTYTPVCTVCLPFGEAWVKQILKIAWIISIIGVVKSIFFANIPKIINVTFYLITGFVIIPYLPLVLSATNLVYTAFFIAGGVTYASGAIVYGTEIPDPNPKIFGYHEIFHLCTIIANLCFAVPIVICVLFP